MTEANSAYLMFNRNSADKISSAAQNAKVIIDTDKWTSFYRNVIDALAKRPDLTVKIRFTDEKHARRCITIPAGTDLDGFIDSKGPAAILDYYPRILLISFSGISTSFAISA